MALASLRSLRSRNFALIWSAALVSNVGTWMQAVALGVLVYQRTGQAGWTGLVAAAAFVPIGLFAPVGGALADRLDRRRWLILTTLAETAFAAALAVLAAAHDDPPIALVLLAFGGGAAGSIGFPAYQAMVPDLVPEEDLLAAVAMSSAQFNLGRVIGPALAGLVLLTHDYSIVFGVNVASFGAVVVALLLVRLPPRPPVANDSSIVTRIVLGARIALTEPGCRAAIFLIALVALLASPFIALVPAMAGVIRHHGVSNATATSILITAQGVGAVAGAVLLPSVALRLGRGRLLTGALVVLPLLLVAYAVAPELWLATLALFAVGAGYITVLSGLNTVVQLRSPAFARGRVLSIYMMGLGLVYPLGAVLQGNIADATGLRAVTAVGALALLAAVVVLTLARPSVFRALGDPKPATFEPLVPAEEFL
ncbi:MAG: MFS transporter [Acidimicrobiales bacterium]